MQLSYPTHFLHDIETMTADQRDARATELIAWVKRYADRNANPKWVTNHMYELSRLLEIARADLALLGPVTTPLNGKQCAACGLDCCDHWTYCPNCGAQNRVQDQSVRVSRAQR